MTPDTLCRLLGNQSSGTSGSPSFSEDCAWLWLPQDLQMLPALACYPLGQPELIFSHFSPIQTQRREEKFPDGSGKGVSSHANSWPYLRLMRALGFPSVSHWLSAYKFFPKVSFLSTPWMWVSLHPHSTGDANLEHIQLVLIVALWKQSGQLGHSGSCVGHTALGGSSRPPICLGIVSCESYACGLQDL
jgi:hypothetical protein